MAEKMTKEEFAEFIGSLTVAELVEYVDYLKEKFNIQAAPVVAAAAVAQPGAAGGGEEEEKSTYDVILEKPGDQKLKVVKLLKEILEVGLKEAKEIIENAPKPIKTGVSMEEAEEIKSKLEAQGATVTIK